MRTEGVFAMLAVILKILSIIGIVLLIAVCLLAVLLLVVLFCPVIYRINGEKDSITLSAKIRVRWLFGLLGAAYCYPEPGRLIIRILCFPVFDSGAGKKTKKKKRRKRKKEGKAAGRTERKESAENGNTGNGNAGNGNAGNGNPENENTESGNTEHGNSENRKAEADGETLSKLTAGQTEEFAEHKPETGTVEGSREEHSEQSSEKEGILCRKVKKIKYTIQKIYDKIKHILEEIGFYKGLLQDEDTKELFSHGCRRIGRVLKHIRPRTLKADVTYGTGSPDTTGYLYAFYGMLSPKLGKAICVVPNFEEQTLEGSFYAAGHITICTLLINILALLMDKRLRILLGRLKAHKVSRPE